MSGNCSCYDVCPRCWKGSPPKKKDAMKIKQRKDMRVRKEALEQVYRLVAILKEQGGKRSMARYNALNILEGAITNLIVETQSKGEAQR